MAVDDRCVDAGALGDKLPEVRKLYDVETACTGDEDLAHELFNDTVFAAGAHGLAGIRRQGRRAGLCLSFRLCRRRTAQQGKGVGHGGEIPFVFGLKASTPIPSMAAALKKATTDKDRAMIAMMQGYWTNFAKTGNPNGEGLPQWPAITSAENHTLVVNDDTKAVTGFHKRRIDLAYRTWAKLAKAAAAHAKAGGVQ